MAIQPLQNDSILSVGLDVVETTEQSATEIAASLQQDAPELAEPEAQQEVPEQDAALQEAREAAARCQAQEEAERIEELEYVHEREELER
ncbi:MAG: hypothetical protein AB7R40_24905 [Nitrospiraceae bacterium]